jgi:hypothetical protein
VGGGGECEIWNWEGIFMLRISKEKLTYIAEVLKK